MDALFWIGQVGWLVFLACGAYVSFCYADLSDAESARMARPDKSRPPATEPGSGNAGFNVSHGSRT